MPEHSGICWTQRIRPDSPLERELGHTRYFNMVEAIFRFIEQLFDLLLHDFPKVSLLCGHRRGRHLGPFAIVFVGVPDEEEDPRDEGKLGAEMRSSNLAESEALFIVGQIRFISGGAGGDLVYHVGNVHSLLAHRNKDPEQDGWVDGTDIPHVVLVVMMQGLPEQALLDVESQSNGTPKRRRIGEDAP